METVELPIVIIDTETNKVVSEFQTYVKPVKENLNPFTTELCGITEDMVFGDDVPTFKQALMKLHKHLLDFGIFKHEFVLVSCGDYDGNQLKREAVLKNIPLPNYLRRWINMKKALPSLGSGKPPKTEGWDHKVDLKKMKAGNKGMPGMLEACKIPLEGRHHSGIDDARNLTKIVQYALGHGFEFNQAMVNYN
jgi:inhibitor of KinA sporulation pathway (predicted exonuclease)